MEKEDNKMISYEQILKDQLDKKIDKEFNDFIQELKRCKPEVILERAYEKVSKEEMIYKIKDRDYSLGELKALLKTDGILDECYDEWLKSDGNFNEVLEYAVDKRIELIKDDYKDNLKKNKSKNR